MTTDISRPPVHEPNYWQNKLDDAEQQGYINGFNYAQQTKPISYFNSLIIGFTIGFLTAFFTFYPG